jgi:hypothetical protein
MSATSDEGSSPPLSSKTRDAPILSVIAVTSWAALFALAAFLLAGRHIATDVWLVYSAAGRHWLAQTPLYATNTIDDFQYFSQAAMLFSALAQLGTPLGGIVWRALGWGLYGHAMWRLSSVASPDQRHRFFLIATALVMLPALTSLLNGQANLHIAALMMHATVDLSGQRLRRVTLWFAVGLAIKPIMAVMVLLSCIQYPAMLWGTLAAVGLLLIVPLASAPATYVVSQYRDCASKLAMSAQPTRLFEDLRGLTRLTLGWLMPHSLLRVLRLLAALGAVGLCRRIRRCWPEPAASFLLFAVAGVYLMLFNARTQPNSYVIVAPAATLAATTLLLQRRSRAALPLLAIVACWCGSATPWTACWLKPLACVVFGALLVRQILRGPAATSTPRSIRG